MAGTTSSGGGRARAGIVGINVTPMVDVVLVLLVIMMVSANFIVSEQMKVELPKAAAGDRAGKTPAIVSVKADGAYGWNDVPVTESELVEKLRQTKADNPEVNLLVAADANAKHAAVVHAMDLAKGEGILHFAVSVEKP